MTVHSTIVDAMILDRQTVELFGDVRHLGLEPCGSPSNSISGPWTKSVPIGYNSPDSLSSKVETPIRGTLRYLTFMLVEESVSKAGDGSGDNGGDTGGDGASLQS